MTRSRPSSCPRSHSSPGTINKPHRAHVTRAAASCAATRSAARARSGSSAASGDAAGSSGVAAFCSWFRACPSPRPSRLHGTDRRHRLSDSDLLIPPPRHPGNGHVSDAGALTARATNEADGPVPRTGRSFVVERRPAESASHAEGRRFEPHRPLELEQAESLWSCRLASLPFGSDTATRGRSDSGQGFRTNPRPRSVSR
jgi:hypothetical protein